MDNDPVIPLKSALKALDSRLQSGILQVNHAQMEKQDMDRFIGRTCIDLQNLCLPAEMGLKQRSNHAQVISSIEAHCIVKAPLYLRLLVVTGQ